MTGYTHTVDIIQRGEADDGFGGIDVSSETTIVSSWECRISRASGRMIQNVLGRVLEDVYTISGEPTSSSIVEGYYVLNGSTYYKIIYATQQVDKSGEVDHWHLLCSKE